ncbi:unnamed protein product [Tilletia controversa]|uniref:Uncharacterized protein n=3 Tax=Tilletia TaxID=13289 RepID=A0A8X7MWT7_9BASI|nr:hypothetical protein CF335_g5385 [Tilletia laevis]KAE8202322.1 hypothetical protein CF328_g2279 [Tilletia controversa]KAE8264057.1 hypothetical protein A4X03_0g1224 [Tilletia caries]KAE8198438.1 hypothetical protein CF336_g1682 [Tilletia laevis]KAE8250107.1 hypothetical protein A4X06_0g2918 [Tilletia controversa]
MPFTQDVTTIDGLSPLSTPQSSPPRRALPRARPYPPAHLSIKDDIPSPPLSSDRDLYHTKTPAPRASQRKVMPSSSSQAVAIGVPSILVKPFRTPLLPKRRIWDTTDDRHESSGGSRGSKAPRRLGTTPARAAMKTSSSAGIFIPTRFMRSPSPDEASEKGGRVYAGSSPNTYTGSSIQAAVMRSGEGGDEVKNMRQGLDAPLGLLSESDLNFGQQEGSMYAPLRSSPEPVSSNDGAAWKPTASGRGHFEFAQEFVLSPRLRPTTDHGIHAQVRGNYDPSSSPQDGSMLQQGTYNQRSDSFVEDGLAGHPKEYALKAQRDPEPYSSPQVKPRSSSPFERVPPSSPPLLDHHHVAPSQWGQSNFPGSGFETENGLLMFSLMDELESPEARDRVPLHAVNELSDALGGSDGAAEDHGLGYGRAGGGTTTIHAAGNDGDEDHHPDSDGEGDAEGNDDTASHQEYVPTCASAEADCGLGDDGDVNGEDLPSLAELRSSMQIRIVTSSNRQAS